MVEATPAQAEIIARMLEGARRIRSAYGWGALHIFVEDGNCHNDDLEFCRQQPNITAEEIALLNWIRENLSEEELYGAWALAQSLDYAP